MVIGVQRQTKLNPITIVFVGIIDHLCSIGFLIRLRESTTVEDAVWSSIEEILESRGEIIDLSKGGGFQFILSAGYAHLPGGLKFVYAIIALFSELRIDVIIPAPNREVEGKNRRQSGSKLSAVWSDISNARRGFKDPCCTAGVA